MCADVDFRIILSAGMSKAKEAGTPGDLDRREWYFENDELSDDELRASHAHEYGREIAKRSRYVLTQLKILWLANELPKKHQQRGPDLSGASIFHPTLPKKIKRHPDRVRGDEAKFKLWLFGIPVDTLGSRGSEKAKLVQLPRKCTARCDTYRVATAKGGDTAVGVFAHQPRTSALRQRTTRRLSAVSNPISA